jgi:septal ring factor EnvC (AmiA/AmiB activator)
MWKDLLLDLLPRLLSGAGPAPARSEAASQRNADEMALAQMNQGITTGLARAVTAQETLVRQLETQLGEQREAVNELGQNMVRVRLAVRSLDGRLERMEKKESTLLRLIVVLVVMLAIGLGGLGWFLWEARLR